MDMMIHASAVAIAGAGVLIAGEAGSGKSSLCAQLMSLGAQLISDDQTILTHKDGGLYAAPPPELAGLLELSGIGIVDWPDAAHAPVALVLGGSLSDAPVERLPTPASRRYLDVDLPWFDWPAQDGSIAAKITLLTQVFQQFGASGLVDVAKRGAKG